MSIRRPDDNLQPNTTRTTAGTMVATIYSEIVAMNNAGSLLLNAGNLEGASASFSSALQALQKTPGPSATNSQRCKMEATTTPPSIGEERRLAPKIECFFSSRPRQVDEQHDVYGLGVGQQSPPSSSINYTTSTPRSWLFSSGGNFVHDQPIVLYQHDVECGDKVHTYDDKEPTSMAIMVAEPRVFQIVSFCVLYNLALSTHLLAMAMLRTEEDPRSGQEHSFVLAVEASTTLQQALKLYAHAHVLLTRCSVREDYCMLYDLAIFNNHGHVLYKLGRVAEGRRNFQVLFQCIILRIKTRCGRYESWRASHPSCLSHHHLHADNQAHMLDGLLSNILYYLMGSCKNAPAA